MSILTANMSLNKAADTDNAKTYLDTSLAASLDVIDAHNHDGSAGGLAVLATAIAAGTPTTAGKLGISSSHLNFGDGTNNHVLVDLDSAQSVTGVKTFTTPNLTGPVVAAATPTVAGALGYGGGHLNVGDGAANHVLVDLDSVQSVTGVKTFTTPVLSSPVHSAATPTVAGAVGYGGGHLNVGDGSANHVLADLDSAQTISAVKTFSTAPVIGTITNTGTLTLPTSTDTLVGRATTDTLTNKTLSSPTFSGTAVGPLTVSVAGVTGLDLQSGHSDLGQSRPLRVDGSGNVIFSSDISTAMQSMTRGLYVSNAGVVPTGNPASGGFLYVVSGALTYRGSSGTVTTLASA